MHIPEMLILLFLVICVATIAAQRLRVAYPIAYLASGIALAFVDHLPDMRINPEWMLVLFLPPLLMEAAYFTSYRDFRRNFRWILQLAVGLVFASAFAVAYVLQQLIPGAGWALGLVLGAVVSPPDAAAATSMIKHLRVPKRIVTILEGESLINDATGLVLYKFAVAAVVTGSFSAAQASMSFVWMVAAGLGVGLSAGWIYMKLFPHIRELSVEILSTFVLPYLAYILAESVGGSGVLAVVSGGLVVGWLAPETFTPQFRLPAEAVWQMTVYVLNGLVFCLIGLEFPRILAELGGYAPATLIGYAGAVFVAAVLVRFVWVFGFAYGIRFLFPRMRKNDPYPAWQNVTIVAWTGMRGVVTVATALALPYTLADGTPFPHRDLIIFLALSLVCFTLVFQGLLLPTLLRVLKLNYNAAIIQEDWEARVVAAREALCKLEDVAREKDLQGPALERIRSHYRDRLESLGDGPNTPLFAEQPMTHNHPLVQAEHRIWQEALNIERQAVITLRKSFKIGDEVMNDMLREIDYMTNRFRV